MIKPFATVDFNTQERLPPNDQINAPTRKSSVTVLPVNREHSHVCSPAIPFVSNMQDINAAALSPFDLSYISCPLQTLAKTLKPSSSGCITTIDIAQAYQTLYNRLRASTNIVITNNQDSDEYSQFKIQLSNLVQCLQRDISEGLQFFSRVQSTSLRKSSLVDTSFTSMLEDPEMQLSIDSSLLCQSALRVAAVLMMVPAIHTRLSGSSSLGQSLLFLIVICRRRKDRPTAYYRSNMC